MSEQRTIPPRSGDSFADRLLAYDPVTRPQLFQGVIGKRVIAFIVDAIIITVVDGAVYVAIAVLGIFTLGLAWLLFGLVFPAVGLGYNALTIGGPNSATIGQRMMGLEVPTWFGGKVTPAGGGLPRAAVLVLARHLLPDSAVGLVRPAEALPARHSGGRGGDQPPLAAQTGRPGRPRQSQPNPGAFRISRNPILARSAFALSACYRLILSALGRFDPGWWSVTEHKSNFPEFYITAPQPCPYLPGKLERKLFTHLTREKPDFLIDNLLKGGFRRSQNIAYMPYCDACSACVPVRILVDAFRPRRSLQRIARANRDVVASRMEPTPTPGAIFVVPRLYRRASRRWRHGGDVGARLLAHGRGQRGRDLRDRISPEA